MGSGSPEALHSRQLGDLGSVHLPTSRQVHCFLTLLSVCFSSPQTGDFFGEIEGAVMNKLLAMGSFKR